MQTHIFAINLDRSVDRWTILSNQAELLGFHLVRVPGIEGAKVAPQDRIDCDERAFAHNNGRTVLPGEYGCYRSHMNALIAFAETGAPVGLIVEDDIKLTADLLTRAEAAIEALPKADAIKLFNHRIVGFKLHATSKEGDEIGRATHGPQGSAACYVVTHTGAKRLIEGLKIMSYPWDVALERGWGSRTEIYTTRADVTISSAAETTIASRAIYRSVKFRWWRRFRTYAIRTIESAVRIVYAYRR